MKLYFKNSHGEERVIGEPCDIQDVYKLISDFVNEHNYKSYYTRVQPESKINSKGKYVRTGRIEYDVGSWTEFFYLGELNDQTFNYYLEKGLFK